MGVTPLFVNLAALCALKFDSSPQQTWQSYASVADLLTAAFPLPHFAVVGAFLSFVAFQLLLFVTLPGKTYPGALAPSGFQPRFKAHGGPAFLITAAAYLLATGVVHIPFMGALPYTPLFHAEWIYDNLLELLTLLNMSALLLSLALFAKGLYRPSTPDHGSSHSAAFRVYIGEELYPSLHLPVLNVTVDLKHFVICRLGMMGWFLFTLSFTAAAVRAAGGQWSPALAASAGCNMLYVAKFFLLFEVPGYMSAADIAVDRFGFMLAWGTLCFMPLVHNLQTLHLVAGSGTLQLSWPGAVAWVAVGCVMIFMNYDADTQRHRVRAAGGKCTVWGKPAECIAAEYRDAAGKKHTNLLVCSGYLGLVRHFHYMPDIVLLFLYCAPAGFTRLLPWSYFFYLTSLLLDRCQRIDARCAAKYGAAWQEYCRRVPYKLVPGVF